MALRQIARWRRLLRDCSAELEKRNEEDVVAVVVDAAIIILMVLHCVYVCVCVCVYVCITGARATTDVDDWYRAPLTAGTDIYIRSPTRADPSLVFVVFVCICVYVCV